MECLNATPITKTCCLFCGMLTTDSLHSDTYVHEILCAYFVEYFVMYTYVFCSGCIAVLLPRLPKLPDPFELNLGRFGQQ